MKTSILICIRSLCLFSLLICLPAFVHAQERLQIADLFSKYGEQKDVTRVELNGSILKSYRMTTYKSLVFKIMYPPIARKFSRPLYTTSKTTQRRRRR